MDEQESGIVDSEVNHFAAKAPSRNGTKAEVHSGEFFCFLAFLIRYEFTHAGASTLMNSLTPVWPVRRNQIGPASLSNRSSMLKNGQHNRSWNIHSVNNW
jgi:hypothetical protein